MTNHHRNEATMGGRRRMWTLHLHRTLAVCVLVTFAVSAVLIAYAAGRHQAMRATPTPGAAITTLH